MITSDLALAYFKTRRDLLCQGCLAKDKNCGGCEEKEMFSFAIDALEADTKKKPIAEESGFLCPNCDTAVWHELDYCPSCGQALDWERK